MLQYLIILLDDTSVSYCHYKNTKTERKLISPAHLQAGILFAMKENLMVQFVYPDYELPEAYKKVIESIDHHTIAPLARPAEKTDVGVTDDWAEISESGVALQKVPVWVLRTSKDDLFVRYEKLSACIRQVKRLNITITDPDTFQEKDFDAYKKVLSHLQSVLKDLYTQGLHPQLNLLSDRMLLDRMNNCNAGTENITLAPDGRFYICPAFYMEDENDSVGDVINGLNIKNKVLYCLDRAPLCRTCDAYQCKRCVWLNRKTTLEVNTPSHEQCVVAHLERNASRELLQELQAAGNYFPDREIKEITYLDPFDVREKFLT